MEGSQGGWLQWKVGLDKDPMLPLLFNIWQRVGESSVRS